MLRASRRIVETQCRECGASFVGPSGRRYCSAACRIRWNNRQLNEKRYKERHARKAKLEREQQEEQKQR